MKNALAIIALASSLTTTAHADGTPQVPEGLLSCSKLQDAAERVRCYDAQVAAMKNATKGPAPAATSPSSAPPAAAPAASAAPGSAALPAATPAVRAPAEASEASEASRNAGSAAPSAVPTAPVQPSATRENSAAAHFGEEELPPSQQPKRGRNEETLSSSIAEVTKGPAGIYYFSLANGQVWREEGSQLSLSPVISIVFRVGAPIRIERGALGSYHMWAPAVGAKNWMYVRRIR